MSIPAFRDATVVLQDSNSWTAWYRQFRMKCEALGLWHLADPKGTTLSKIRLSPPIPPSIANYEPATVATSSTASSSRTRGNTQPRQETTLEALVPTVLSGLSTRGQEAYRDDREDYKLRLEAYKLLEREY